MAVYGKRTSAEISLGAPSTRNQRSYSHDANSVPLSRQRLLARCPI
jgi:hypothetical protein